MTDWVGPIDHCLYLPLLVLREGGSVPEERHPGEQPLRVLVPLDGSDYARAALVPAAYLAAALAVPGQGALHLTHIVQPAHEARVPTRTARPPAPTAPETPHGLKIRRAGHPRKVHRILH